MICADSWRNCTPTLLQDNFSFHLYDTINWDLQCYRWTAEPEIPSGFVGLTVYLAASWLHRKTRYRWAQMRFPMLQFLQKEACMNADFGQLEDRDLGADWQVLQRETIGALGVSPLIVGVWLQGLRPTWPVKCSILDPINTLSYLLIWKISCSKPQEIFAKHLDVPLMPSCLRS